MITGTSTDSVWSITGATAVTPAGIIPGATIIIDDGRITSVGHLPPVGDVLDVHGSFVVPGFIDLHVHGGGGASFNSPDPDEIDTAVRFHRAHGTTRTLASLVSESVDNTILALRAISRSEARRNGTLLGAHMEGPFLSPERRGCHDPIHLLAPDLGILERLLSVEPGLVRTMTIAPELPGAEALITRLRDSGVKVGIGHSDADFDQAKASLTAGVSFVTHAHNAMAAMHHRAPGILGAATTDENATLELISDGVHIHPSVIALTFNAAPRRIALITDAAPSAGMYPGYQSYIGSAAVITKEDGTIRRRDSDDILAGSALTMDAALRHTLAAGVGLEAAVHAASTAPALLLGVQEHLGSLRAGNIADLVVLDNRYEVEHVVSAGTVAERSKSRG